MEQIRRGKASIRLPVKQRVTGTREARENRGKRVSRTRERRETRSSLKYARENMRAIRRLSARSAIPKSFRRAASEIARETRC